MIRTIFMGTAAFGEPALEALAEHPEVEVAGVFTPPDRSAGRGQEEQSPPIARLARELEVPLFQPEDINREGLERLESLGEIELGILIAYGQLLEEPVFNYPNYGMMNFHASLLPRWRGATPIRQTLLAGDRETGVTVFRIENELDAGPVAHSVRTAVKPGETYGELYDRLSQLNLVGLNLLLSDVRNGTLSLKPQQGEACHAPRLASDDPKIKWDRPGEQIANHVRAFSPDPGAYSFLNGDRIKIYRVHPMEARDPAEPGTTIQVDTGQLLVKTIDGAVAIEELQPSGSRKMSIGEFLAGRSVEPGTRWSQSGD